MTGCPHTAKFVEPLRWQDGDTLVAIFGIVAVCAKCMRPHGDPKILKTNLPKLYNATSWATMMRVHPHPPYVFRTNTAKTLMVPQTYDEAKDKEELF